MTTELSFVPFNYRKITILTKFCNPEIPGLGRRQSRDWDAANPRIGENGRYPRIPGLQTLLVNHERATTSFGWQLNPQNLPFPIRSQIPT